MSERTESVNQGGTANVFRPLRREGRLFLLGRKRDRLDAEDRQDPSARREYEKPALSLDDKNVEVFIEGDDGAVRFCSRPGRKSAEQTKKGRALSSPAVN
ncbi:hypothetical protein ALCH109712_05915 [Alkalicoccus chagannorensis]